MCHWRVRCGLESLGHIQCRRKIGDLWCYIGVEGYEHLHMEMFDNEQLEPIEFSTLKLHGKKDGLRLLQAASAMMAKAHQYLPTNSIRFYRRPKTSQLILKLSTREGSKGDWNRTFPSFEEATTRTEEFVTITKKVLDAIDQVGAGTDVVGTISFDPHASTFTGTQSERISTALWKSFWESMGDRPHAEQEGVNKVYLGYCRGLRQITAPLPAVYARVRIHLPPIM
ncbi:hypothetical protein C8R43DRAFT_950090 [Mycena crocata]|nr:hypothetical protein C8R43DRAFT_950090 [Mycena crocata]